MPKPRRAFQNIFDRLARQHALAPPLDARPILDIHAQKGEHPRHGEGEIGQVGESGTVLEGDVLLFLLAVSRRGGEALF